MSGVSTDTDSAAYFIEAEEGPLLAMARANEEGGSPASFKRTLRGVGGGGVGGRNAHNKALIRPI